MATIEELDAVIERKEKLAKIDQLLAQQPAPAQQRDGLLPPTERPIRDGALAAATPERPRPSQELSPRVTKPSDLPFDLERELGNLAISAGKSIGDVLLQNPGIRSIFESFTGAGRITKETAGLPEVAAAKMGAGDLARVQALMTTITDPAEQQQALSTVLDNPIFSTDDKGVTSVEFDLPDGGRNKAVLNAPGMSLQDLNQSLFQVLSFIPAAKLAAKATALAARLGLGFATSATTQAAIEEVQTVQGGQRDPKEVVTAGALGVAGEAPAAIATAAARRGATRAAGALPDELLADVAASTRTAQEASRETGIPLFQAQQTQIPSELVRQRLVAQLPAGSQTAIKALKRQNVKASDAVEKFLGDIAPPESLATGAKRIRSASQQAIEDVKLARSEATAPAFKAAYDDAAKTKLQVNVNEPINQIKELTAGRRKGDMIRILLEDIEDGIQEAAKTQFRGSNLKPLHNEKRAITQAMQKFERESAPLDSEIKRSIKSVRRSLTKELRGQSSKYENAMEEFIAKTPDVERLETAVGEFAQLEDNQLKGLANTLFNPETTNVQLVRNAQKAIQDVDPDAWNQIVRVELENRIGKIKAGALDRAPESAENIPANLFSAIFGNEKQTNALRQALNSEQKKNLSFIQTALGRARLGRDPGSPTAPFGEEVKKLERGVVNSFAKLFKFGDAVTDAARDINFDANVKAAAKALFDPEWAPRMAEIRKLDMRSPAAAKAMTQLLNDIEQSQPQEPEQTQ